ncbi:CapA family protein [Gymnodinialimonas sp. 57CJ19]|uniref:CapA family protein n=1 Tax=Gymnodinialimonas sp. 57CJ19 TaxID=3138498 RepID=UPI00313425DD
MAFSFEFKQLTAKARVAAWAALWGAMAVSCTPTGGDTANSCGRPDLAFAGDVLLHSLIQSEASRRPEGFAPAFEPLIPALSQAAVTVVNLEGPAARNVSAANRNAQDPGTLFDGQIYAGYPRFNYHPSIAAVLRNAGVDVVQTANNHAMDRGSLGADRTLSALTEAGLSTTGSHPSNSAMARHAIQQVGGHNLALVACSFSTNGLPDSRSQVLRCYGNSPSIPNLIHSLNAQSTIDGVILLPHWGTEYSARPTARQRRLAQAAADAGAIAIVGSHPHVLQPLEQLLAADGRRVPVAYSLGNLISSQWRLEQRTGAILYLDLARDPQGRLHATDPRYMPTRVERTTDRGVAVFPAAQIAQGAPSVAHAQRILGAGMVSVNPCVTP